MVYRLFNCHYCVDGTPYDMETVTYGVEWGKTRRFHQKVTYHYSVEV